MLVAPWLLVTACNDDGGDADVDHDESPATCAARALGPASSMEERGVLVVLAGDGGAGFVDGASPRFDGIGGLAFVENMVLVTDIFNATLRALDRTTRLTTTLLGEPLQAGAIDGDCAEVRFYGPRGIVADPNDADVAWLGDGPCVRRVDIREGRVTTVAGDCESPGFVDGAPRDARFGFLLHDLEIGHDRRIYVADRANDVVRVVDLDSGTVSTLASGFAGPGALVLNEADATLYVADTFACAVRAVDIVTGESEVVVGRPGACGAVDGDAATARLDTPQGLAFLDNELVIAGFSGDVRVASVGSGHVRTVAHVPAGFFAPFAVDDGVVWAATNDDALITMTLDGEVGFVAGPRNPVGFVDGAGVDARFALPVSAVVLPGASQVLVSDAGNHALRTVDVASGATTTLLGGPGRAGHVDGTFDEARLDYPAGLALADDGQTLWVADNGAGAITRVDLSRRTVTTVARIDDAWDIALDETAGALWVVASAPGLLVRVDLDTGDDVVVADGLAYPVGVAVVDGAVWVAENEDHVLTRVTDDGAVQVVLGTRGFSGVVTGDADVALMFSPSGLTTVDDAAGPAVYVAETGGQVIRRIDRRDFSSRIVVGQPTSSGALPAGASVALADATILNPLDVVVVGDDLVIVGDTTVVLARR
jgi:hypothetical protein